VTAIAGIVQLDSRLPDRAAVERMAALLTPHGPDAQNHVLLPTGALLRTLCRIVPEDSLDAQPMHHGASGAYAVFDGRLDNREELGLALGIADPEARLMADSALALRACLRWGSDSPAHLLGDFALACWYPRERRLCSSPTRRCPAKALRELCLKTVTPMSRRAHAPWRRVIAI
jgi:asparagine synthase (glutamine-hydrolysing)